MTQPAPVPGWKLVAIGAVAGLLGGGLGVGGGIIMVPLLVWVGVDRHRSHATSLAAIVFIAAAGASSFGASGEAALGIGVTVGVGGIVGSVVGASVMHRVSSKALTIVFGFVLLVGGIRMILSADPFPAAVDFSNATQTGIALAIGLVAGFFAGLAGIGGGVVIVPSSVLLLGLDQHQAQGTSLVAIIFTAVAGSIVNLRNRRVRPMDGLFIGVGGIVGSLIGSQVALLMEGRTLSVVFGFLVLYVSVRSLLPALRQHGAG